MPEGDTIFRAARTLHRALAGRVVAQFSSQLAQLDAVDRRAPIVGRTVVGCAARGKHLLIELSGDLFLRSHMRMHGSWHLYRPGERWRAPGRDARIVITTDAWLAIGFGIVDAEFLERNELPHHDRLSALGPDLLSPDFDVAEALRRIRAAPARHVAEAILRQQSMAGLGNVLKCEVLFACRVHPFTPVSSVTEAQLRCLVERGRRLIRLNVEERSIVGAQRFGRITTGRLDPRERLWVYGRKGEPCLRCATPIESATETEGRRTYWCPTCQPAAKTRGGGLDGPP
jgi:endonuclease-8